MSFSLISACVAVLSLLTNGVTADDFENLNNMAVANNALSMSYLSIAFFGCHLNPRPSFAWFDCENDISPRPITFSLNDFVASGYNQSAFEAVNLLARRQYEQLDLVYDLIADIGGNDYIIEPACNYTFANTTTVTEYLHNGLYLTEDTLAFYNGATYSVVNQTLQLFAQVLAGAQARKAAYLHILSGDVVSPPSGLDLVLPISHIAGSVAPYLLRCSTRPFRSQTIRPYGVAYSPAGTIYTGPRAQAARSNYSEANRQSDISSLRLLLSFESAQRALYVAVTAGALSFDAMRDAGYNAATIRPQIANFVTENMIHKNMLGQMIGSLGGNVSECSYVFGMPMSTTSSALGMVNALSTLDVLAYNYVAGLIVDTQIQRQIALIATIESRHNTLFALLTNQWTGWAFDGFQTVALPNALDDFASSESSLISLLSQIGVVEDCTTVTSSSSTASPGQPNNSSSSISSSFSFETSQQHQSSGFGGQESSTGINSAFGASQDNLVLVLSVGFFMIFW